MADAKREILTRDVKYSGERTRVVVGGAREYEARCRSCFRRDGAPPPAGAR